MHTTGYLSSLILQNKEMQRHCILINSSQQGHIFLLVYDCAVIL